jgi:hypothetical protein
MTASSFEVGVYNLHRLDVKEYKKLCAKKDAAGTAKIYKEMRIAYENNLGHA